MKYLALLGVCLLGMVASEVTELNDANFEGELANVDTALGKKSQPARTMLACQILIINEKYIHTFNTYCRIM